LTNSFTSNKISGFIFDASIAKAVFGKKITENDLTTVEGIGPKIAELFENSGITTWKDLSETSIERCKEILKSGGERYRVHIPDTWPKQAKLAYEGKWQELLDWQDLLDGGKA
jgi:predicted flap endonuclease-1-like 5' DNA nuclease